jgi:uncharacterized protein (DUF427 family)
MVKAVGNGKVIGQSDRTKIVDGNHLFPSEALRREFFQPSDAPTICPWKGKAHYYTVLVDGKENTGTEWYYPKPKPAAQKWPAKLPSGKAFGSRSDHFCKLSHSMAPVAAKRWP